MFWTYADAWEYDRSVLTVCNRRVLLSSLLRRPSPAVRKRIRYLSLKLSWKRLPSALCSFRAIDFAQSGFLMQLEPACILCAIVVRIQGDDNRISWRLLE